MSNNKNLKGFTALCEHVGDADIKFQNLGTDYTSTNLTSKKATITFATDPDIVRRMVLDQEPKEVGFVVWMPKDKVDEFKANAAKQ